MGTPFPRGGKTKVFLRSIGQDEGVVGILPSSFDKLVDLARLELYPDHTGTCRVFSSTGDEYTEKTFDVISYKYALLPRILL